MNIKDMLIKWNQNKWEEKNKEMYDGDRKDNLWPWFSEDLDPDFAAFLNDRGINSGRALDLGTCSGTQAIELAKRGLDVVGSDISETALMKARESASAHPELKLKFVWDDIAQSTLASDYFDIIFDRGCFHSICCFSGVEYIKNVLRILKPDGRLILKTMSDKEDRFVDYNNIGNQRIPMPYHFKERQLREVFDGFFVLEAISDSYFYSSVISPPARAYTCVFSPLKQR